MPLAGPLVAGMFGSSSTGASGRAVMGWFGRDERGFALGLRQMALPLGGAVASVALPQLAGAGGLRAAFLTLAGLSLVAAIAAVAFMRDAPPPDRPLPTVPAPPPTRDARLWRLGASGALVAAARRSLRCVLVLFPPDARCRSAGLAAGALAAVQVIGAGMRIVAGRRSDREGLRIAPIRRIALRN